MKLQRCVAALVVLFMVAVSGNAANLQWSAAPTTTAPSSVTATYTAALYLGANPLLWASATPIYTTTYTGSAGGFFVPSSSGPSMATLGLDNGSQIYTHLFNASSIGAATYTATVGSGSHTVTGYNALNPAYTYNAGTGGQWQAVPEPTTLALLGVGLLGLGFRRKR